MLKVGSTAHEANLRTKRMKYSRLSTQIQDHAANIPTPKLPALIKKKIFRNPMKISFHFSARLWDVLLSNRMWNTSALLSLSVTPSRARRQRMARTPSLGLTPHHENILNHSRSQPLISLAQSVPMHFFFGHPAYHSLHNPRFQPILICNRWMSSKSASLQLCYTPRQKYVFGSTSFPGIRICS